MYFNEQMFNPNTINPLYYFLGKKRLRSLLKGLSEVVGGINNGGRFVRKRFSEINLNDPFLIRKKLTILEMQTVRASLSGSTIKLGKERRLWCLRMTKASAHLLT